MLNKKQIERREPKRYALNIFWKTGGSDLFYVVSLHFPRPVSGVIGVSSGTNDDIYVINMDEVKYYVCHPYVEGDDSE